MLATHKPESEGSDVETSLCLRSASARSRVSRGLSLRAGVIWGIAGNIIYALSQWGMLVAIIKMGSPATAGEFILALALTAPIVLFTNLQLRQLQAADSQSAHSFAAYTVLRLTTACIALVAAIAIASLAGWPRTTVYVVAAVALFKTIESFSDLTYGLFQQNERMDYIARSLMLRGPTAAFVFGLAFSLTRSLTWACLAVGAAWLVIFLANDWRKAQSIASSGVDRANSCEALRWSWRELLAIARSGLPLGMIASLWTLNANLPRFFIEQRFGPRELGIFGALAYVHVAGTTFIGAVGQAAIPRLARHFAAGELAAFRHLLTRALLTAAVVGLMLVTIAVLFGRTLLAVLYSWEYSEYAGLFALQMLASCCAYVVSVLECALTSTGCFDSQFLVVVTTTALTAVSTYLTLPVLGLKSVPISMTAAYAFHAISGTVLLWRKCRVRKGSL